MAKGTDQGTSQATQYVVKHGAVGPYFQGQTITAAHFPELDERGIARLVNLGAIVPAESYEGGAILRDLPDGQTTPDGVTVRGEVPLPETAADAPATSA